jgi:hypothetical protein
LLGIFLKGLRARQGIPADPAKLAAVYQVLTIETQYLRHSGIIPRARGSN